MDIKGQLPALPPLPPNFASSPLELVKSDGLKVVVVEILPVLKVALQDPLGNLRPLYFEAARPVGFGSYDEF